MIASGKTTLMHNLAKRLNCELIDEIDPNDEIQNVLLKALYEKKNEVAPAVFQLYFFLTRFENYKRATKDDSLFLVDRTVFEDRLFAHRNMAKDPVTFGFYDVL
jgi:deoxyadenosine/deoxycytidine kinase